MSNCEQAILETLAYKGVFNASVSYFQLTYFLNSKTPYNKLEIDTALNKLVKQKKIESKKNKYSLKNVRIYEWKTRYKNSKGLIEENSRILDTIKSIPWVKMLALTGSVAAFNAKENDDLDILIVTQKNRVWLTRLFVTCILIIANKYPRTETKNKLCPNIYLSENALKWDKRGRNYYTANEVVLLQPYFYKDNIYFSFLQKNDWAKKYLCNYPFEKTSVQRSTNKNSLLIDKLEYVLYKLQTKYMRKRQTTEHVSKDIIHFNKNDSTNIVLHKYTKLINNK